MSFLRHKSGGAAESNLTGNITSEDVSIDDVRRYGFEGQVCALTYDPVQSLLAVGTSQTDKTLSNVYVFGGGRVTAKYELPKNSSVKYLRMYDNRLIVVDARHELHHIDMTTHQKVVSWSPPGAVSSVLSDPASDYIFIGLQNGDIVAFDLDRDIAAPFKIPNLWRSHDPKAISTPVVSLAIHPRDLGTLLIGFPEGAILYSLKQSKPTVFIRFEVPAGAPGGDTDPTIIKTKRYPKLSHAIFNPAGSTILTTHDDGCLAFWSSSDGRLLTARTVQDLDVHLPGTPAPRMPATGGNFSMREPFQRVAWCCTQNIDETSILVAGGGSVGMPAKGISVIEFAKAPNYTTSSWKQIVEHLSTPKRQRFLPSPQNIDTIDFCLIPRSSPYFAGAHDPVAAVVLFTNGDIAALRLPDGSMVSPASMFHVSLGLIQPKVISMDTFTISRQKWLGMVVSRDKPDPYLKGGAEGKRSSRRNLDRNIAYTMHKESIIRLWDIGHNDEIELKDSIEIDLSSAVSRPNIKITAISAASATAEMAVGLESGELVIYRWGRNKSYHSLGGPPSANDGGYGGFGGGFGGFGDFGKGGFDSGPQIKDISSQADPSVKEGLLPLFLLEGAATVTSVAVSDVGFVAVGYDDGNLTLIDLRGPTIIGTVAISSFIKEVSTTAAIKRGSLGTLTTSITKDLRKASLAAVPKGLGKATLSGLHLRKQSVAAISAIPEGQEASSSTEEFVQTMAFSVMTLEGEDYSSICLHAGTNQNHVVSFKILPDGPRYNLAPAGVHDVDDASVKIIPLNVENGTPAGATPQAVGGLREGRSVRGMLICVSKSGARIITPPDHKISSKSWDNACLSASIVELEDKGIALACVMNTGKLKMFSIPALKDIGTVDLPAAIDFSRLSECRVSREGYVTAWTGPVEIGLFYLWGVCRTLKDQPKDSLHNPEVPVPPRPTISNLQWIKGTQHISADDFDQLVGGVDRPMSKKQLEEARRAAAAQGGAGKQGGAAGAGLFGSMAAGFNQRTQNLTNFQDNMAHLENTTTDFAKATTKFIEQQKRQAALGTIKKFF
ncbi:hypothetical protein H072_1302 [Dactylellina haptotyla CBS 200.50]|uniref:Lethal giant larvae (Lgl)-like C-terminal domain-containing protein n=1 Tax=Dactylellina haptotyla (strain CBS 200.50) TaxID=1284197 RepID=S8AUT3_DACHA|nr:hypothetical protein H072_1302 [Dactylellina haptotyla CBS 200.50]